MTNNDLVWKGRTLPDKGAIMDVIDDILLCKDRADALLFKKTWIKTYPSVAEENLRLALSDFNPKERKRLQKLFKIKETDDVELHHIHAYSRGGGDEEENESVVHKACNRAFKGNL